MSLYAVGRTTGLVCDSGDSFTNIVPVFEGFSIPHAVKKMKISGLVLTDYMQRLLKLENEWLTSSEKLKIVLDIKEKLCFVASNYEKED